MITAAVPKGVPLPVESQAKNPDKPEIIMPKTGIKIANTEKTSEAIPKASIVLLIIWLENMMKFVKKAEKKHYMVALLSNKTR